MSVRDPTAFNTFVDIDTLKTGESILTTAPSQIVDDQMFILDRGEMIVAAFDTYYATNSAAFVDMFTIYFDSKDMCDVDGVTDNEIAHSVFFYGYTDAAQGEVRLTSTASSNNTSTATLTNTVQWVQGDSINIKTNGNEETATVAIRVTTATQVYLFGIAIFADET